MTALSVGTEVVITDHARQRFGERVRQALGHEELEAELAAILEHARLVPCPPPWFRAREKEASPLYLELGGDAVFPLRPSGDGEHWYAVTCIAKGEISEQERSRRKRRRRERAARC